VVRGAYWLAFLLVLVPCLPQSALAQEAEVFEKMDEAAQAIVADLAEAAKRQSGLVVDVDELHQVYVALGAGQSVVAGELLDLVERGQAITGVNEELLGYQETPVAVLKVDRLQGEGLAVCSVESLEPGKQPAKGQVAYTRGIPTNALAVADLLNAAHQPNQLGHEFALHLGHQLSSHAPFTVLEREQLDAALKELKLGLNDLFDATKARQLGRLLPGEGIVLGEDFQGAGSYIINVRVVDLETGAAVETASVKLTRSPEFDEKFAAPYPRTGGGGPGAGAFPPSTNLVLYGGQPDPRIRQAFAEAGLQIEQMTQVPEKLDPAVASAIVLQDPTCLRPGDGERIVRYLEVGGGVALVGAGPVAALAGTSADYHGFWTSSIAQWLGVSRMVSYHIRGIAPTGSFPPGYNAPRVLFRHLGEGGAYQVQDYHLSEFAHPVLVNTSWGSNCVGFTHTYGDGRVYWQTVIDGGPNYPQLSEYFAWAVRWVAHMPPGR